MAPHEVPAFYAYDAIPPVIIAGLYILACSLIREPARRNFNAIMIGGAGAAYLSGGFGVWEFVFTAVVTFCAYKGLQSYRYIGIGWLLHTGMGRDASFLWPPDRSVRAALVSGMCDHRRAHRDLVFRRRAFRL